MDDNQKIIKATWNELGFKMRALKYWVYVRTDPVHRRSQGGVWLPDQVSDFWGGGLGHQRMISAVVCSVGPAVWENYGFQEGDRIAFKRVHFAQYRKMDDGTYFGWLAANEVVGFPEPEALQEATIPAPLPEQVQAEEPILLDPEYAM